MSTPMIVPRRQDGLPLRQRLLALAAVAVARLLATCSPERIRTVLCRVRCGARPASQTQALAAREAVNAVSMVCREPQGCVPRSIATALLCRARGVWPTWCVGVRKIGPFGAHAWVEAEGAAVGEPYPADYFRTLMAVRPESAQVS